MTGWKVYGVESWCNRVGLWFVLCIGGVIGSRVSGEKLDIGVGGCADRIGK